MRDSKLKKNKVQKMMAKALRGVAPHKHDNNQDKALIVAYLNGDHDAGMALAESYLDFFSTIMNKPTDVPYKSPAMQRLWADPTYHDYEDLFQEILLHFFIMVHEYDPETAPFASFIGSTLKQRVFNNFFSEFLKVKTTEEIEYDDAIDIEGKIQSILLDEDTAKKVPAQYLELYEALNKLSKRQREVIEMSVIKGWDSTVIADELGMSSNTVRVHLKRGLEKLKTIMGADDIEKVS
jgi:RNA polymerase sigma factor (sigma-70 family)